MNVRNILLSISGFLLIFAVIEGVSRLLFTLDDRPFQPETAFWDYHFVPDVGSLRKPDQVLTYRNACLSIDKITYDSTGMRKAFSDPDKPVSIAVVGDSYLEAVQIVDGQNVAAQLGQLLNVGIRNASISNANALKQSLMYRTFLAPLAPRIVLNFAYPKDDILDTNCDFLDTRAKMTGGKSLQACAMRRGDDLSLRAPRPYRPKDHTLPTARSDLSYRIKQHCRTCALTWDALKQLGVIQNRGQYDEYMKVGNYLSIPKEQLETGEQKLVRDALFAISRVLRAFRDDVESHDGTYIVVLVPSHHEYAPNWETEIKGMFGITPPDGFDPHLPTLLMKQLLNEADITTIDLGPVFDRFIARHRLPFPWLSFRCDTHWNPIGHYLAASFVAQRLVEMELVKVPDPEGFIAARIAERQRSPTEIVGDRAYAQIYGGGFYKPGQL